MFTLCNYFVLFFAFFLYQAALTFLFHLSPSHSVTASHTFIPQPSFSALSRCRCAPVDAPLLHPLFLFFFKILFLFHSFSLSIFLLRSLLPNFLPPMSVFLINSSPPASPTLSPCSLSIQLRLGELHCTSQCWLSVPMRPAMLSVVSCWLDNGCVSHTVGLSIREKEWGCEI